MKNRKCIGVLVLLMVIASPLFAVPPPTPQLTADCLAPVYASDQLLCEDPQLRALDAQMVELLQAFAIEEPASPVLNGQQEWFQQSRKCAFESAHRECLLQAYCVRLQELSAALQPEETEQPGCTKCPAREQTADENFPDCT